MCCCKTGNENSLRVQKGLLFPPYENRDRNTTARCPHTNNQCPIKNMTPIFHNSDSTLSPNFLWKKSEMIDEVKDHKALTVKSHRFLCTQFRGLNFVNTIFLVKFEQLGNINTMTRCSKFISNIFHTFDEMRYGHWQ